MQAIASAFTAVVLLYPDICIGGMFTLLFWAHSYIGLTLSLVALTAVVPSLITRDRASNALSIYLSRPLTSFDYLVGKLGIIVGILLFTWTGPLLFSWMLSMLFAPQGDFFLYSLEPLGRACLFNLVSLITLAAVALGVSSATRTTRNTVLLWIGAWIIAGSIAGFPTSPEWLRAASFAHDLNTIRDAIFNLEEVLTTAASSIPFLGADITRQLERAAHETRVDGLDTALIGLPILVGCALFFLFRRLRPE
jgi:ABC-2 type transport system permease protein